MDEIDGGRVEDAARHTEILRSPRQSLATFGVTNVYYYLVTEAAYSNLLGENNETVVREGRVVAERPRIVTPYYLSHLEGFSADAGRYLDTLMQAYGPNAPGLFYIYRNEPKDLSIVSDNWPAVVDRLNREIDRKGDPLTTIIKGEDELWDVSLLKFIFEMTRRSVSDNISEMGARGLLNVDSSGVPADARMGIERLFREVMNGEREPGDLERELTRWNVFEEYQDRFFALFRRR